MSSHIGEPRVHTATMLSSSQTISSRVSAEGLTRADKIVRLARLLRTRLAGANIDTRKQGTAEQLGHRCRESQRHKYAHNTN